MERIAALLEPQDCALLMVDFQAGLAFGVESAPRQMLLNSAIALAETAMAFGIPVIASTSASKVYSGPLLPAIKEVLPEVDVLERRSMNAWEDDRVREAILAAGRRRLLIAGLLTEACVTFPTLSALEHGLDVYVVADACGGLSLEGHHLALRRMEAAGACMTSWIQVLLELQRDWTRQMTYAGASSVVKAHAGGYGMGLVYAKEMIHPS